jgi:hypothetical protein
MGSRCQSSNAVPRGARQYEPESRLDIRTRRRLRQPAAGPESGDSNHASAGSAGRKPENYPPADRNNNGKTIVIQPATPDVVYVPQYDPWLVYGDPLAVFPGWYPYPGLFWDGPGVYWGLGFGIGFFAGFGWGWNHWGYDWHGGQGHLQPQPVHLA